MSHKKGNFFDGHSGDIVLRSLETGEDSNSNFHLAMLLKGNNLSPKLSLRIIWRQRLWEQAWRLTGCYIPLKLKNLWDRHCENNCIKAVRRACTGAYFPFSIFEADLSNMVIVEDICICWERKREANRCHKPFGDRWLINLN